MGWSGSKGPALEALRSPLGGSSWTGAKSVLRPHAPGAAGAAPPQAMLRASLLTSTYLQAMEIKQNKISYQVGEAGPPARTPAGAGGGRLAGRGPLGVWPRGCPPHYSPATEGHHSCGLAAAASFLWPATQCSCGGSPTAEQTS